MWSSCPGGPGPSLPSYWPFLLAVLFFYLFFGWPFIWFMFWFLLPQYFGIIPLDIRSGSSHISRYGNKIFVQKIFGWLQISWRCYMYGVLCVRDYIRLISNSDLTALLIINIVTCTQPTTNHPTTKHTTVRENVLNVVNNGPFSKLS